MSILVNKDTRLIVQGITGREGGFHASQMIEYGTNVVAGVTPGRGGETFEGKVQGKVPIYNTVLEAVEKEEANVSIIYVPAPFAADAVLEAADAGLELAACITEGIPTLDMLRVDSYLRGTNTRLIGPNCPGVITPEETKVGIMPGHIHKAGSVGVVSRSGTLTYEVVAELTRMGIGQSTCVGIGGDPVIGTTFVDVLGLFQEDEATDLIVMIGEIGGTGEEEAAEFISKNVTKPVVGFIAGQTAPADKRMGHAGAIVSGGQGTAVEKMKALSESGVAVAKSPFEIGDLVSANKK